MEGGGLRRPDLREPLPPPPVYALPGSLCHDGGDLVHLLAYGNEGCHVHLTLLTLTGVLYCIICRLNAFSSTFLEENKVTCSPNILILID